MSNANTSRRWRVCVCGGRGVGKGQRRRWVGAGDEKEPMAVVRHIGRAISHVPVYVMWAVSHVGWADSHLKVATGLMGLNLLVR